MNGVRETRRRRIVRVVDVVVVVLTVVDALNWLSVALTPGLAFTVLVGLALAGRVLRDHFRRGRHLGTAGFVIVLVVESLGGLVTAAATPGLPDRVAALHLLWIVVFVAGTITRSVLLRGMHRARQQDAQTAYQEAERARVEWNRQQELAHVSRVERERGRLRAASGPGRITGYEPSVLRDVVLERTDTMYGDPGVGLDGAGFDARAVERGREGELNFAKALADRGLLGRFATFWSVHMPEDGVGASAGFQTDIDCVVLTGGSLWLVDVKNYNQGAVTWITEMQDAPVLIAVDDATGGRVGGPRRMTRNMEMARSRFVGKLQAIGVDLQVKPVVVMMPREDGLGTVRDVFWPGGIPAGGLPDVLRWMESEPDFVPTDDDAALLVRILSVLTKDETGSAPVAGGQVRQQTARSTTTTATPATASVPASTPDTDGSRRSCRSCGATLLAEQAFCFECGEPA